MKQAKITTNDDTCAKVEDSLVQHPLVPASRFEQLEQSLAVWLHTGI